jgi:hypothetical protein
MKIVVQSKTYKQSSDKDSNGKRIEISSDNFNHYSVTFGVQSSLYTRTEYFTKEVSKGEYDDLAIDQVIYESK